jgi:hypothetical protein
MAGTARSTSVVMCIICVVAILALPHASLGQTDEFRWLNRTPDAQTFQKIEAAFAKELEPDRPGTTGNVVPMSVKYVEKIGKFRGTDLVILGYKEDSADVYPAFRAFNFNPQSGDKTVIRGAEGGDEWLRLWKFKKVAHLEDKQLPDLVFVYFSCTECEAEKLLASYRYEAASKSWALRYWSQADGDNLMIGSDNQFGDDGVYSYECLHTIQDLTKDGIDDVAVRCRELVDPGDGKPTRVTKDETVLYTLKQGAFVRAVLSGSDPRNADVEAALCRTAMKSPLCKGK